MFNDLLLRLPQVLSIFPVSRASWYRGIKQGHYPAPTQIGLRAVGWRASEISALIQTGIGAGLIASTSQKIPGHNPVAGLHPTEVEQIARRSSTGSP